MVRLYLMKIFFILLQNIKANDFRVIVASRGLNEFVSDPCGNTNNALRNLNNQTISHKLNITS